MITSRNFYAEGRAYADNKAYVTLPTANITDFDEATIFRKTNKDRKSVRYENFEGSIIYTYGFDYSTNDYFSNFIYNGYKNDNYYDIINIIVDNHIIIPKYFTFDFVLHRLSCIGPSVDIDLAKCDDTEFLKWVLRNYAENTPIPFNRVVKFLDRSYWI